jgi:hypothetical protein
VNIPIPREGALTVTLSVISPPTVFGAVSVDAACAGDATGKTVRQLGYDTTWTMPVVPGDYCVSLITAQRMAEDVWFTLTVLRP